MSSNCTLAEQSTIFLYQGKDVGRREISESYKIALKTNPVLCFFGQISILVLSRETAEVDLGDTI